MNAPVQAAPEPRTAIAIAIAIAIAGRGRRWGALLFTCAVGASVAAGMGSALPVLGCSSRAANSKPVASADSAAMTPPEGADGSSADGEGTPFDASAGRSGRFGADTPGGGAGGVVLKVRTLEASGPGSLREALAARGPRVIVFEVGGNIDLDRTRLDVYEPFVTIAGETAPSPGISIVRGGLRVFAHDVIVRHLRLRMGDAGAAAASGFEPDVTTDGPAAYRVLFDHCSVAWGVDENLSVSGPRFDGPLGTSHDVTIQSSIIAEGLRNSIHAKGTHSMGTLIHDYCTNVAVVGNFYAHNDERNPWFKAFGGGVIVNNLIYNPGTWAMRLGAVVSEWSGSGITPEPPRVSIVGNYLRHGPNTPPSLPMVGSNSAGAAYLLDNIAVDVTGAPALLSAASITVLGARPSWPLGLVARPATEVADWVLDHAGARPRDRDALDRRLVADFRAGTGALIDSQEQVGGYPVATPTARPLDVPLVGVDEWLSGFANALE